MKRSEILAKVRSTGRKCPWHRLEYLLTSGQLPEPMKDARGHRIFTAAHLDGLIHYIDKRRQAVETY